MQARVVIFCMQVGDNVLYRGIVNQSSTAYSLLYLSEFLIFHTLNNEILVKDFCKTVQARIVILSMYVNNDVLYLGITNQPSIAYSSPYLSDFLSFRLQIIIFFVKDFCKTVQAKVVIFAMQVDNNVLYCGIVNQPSAAYSSQYCAIFFLSIL